MTPSQQPYIVIAAAAAAATTLLYHHHCIILKIRIISRDQTREQQMYGIGRRNQHFGRDTTT